MTNDSRISVEYLHEYETKIENPNLETRAIGGAHSRKNKKQFCQHLPSLHDYTTLVETMNMWNDGGKRQLN